MQNGQLKKMDSKQYKKLKDYQEQLEYWKQKKREEGSNYINDFYISKYESQIEDIKYPKPTIENYATTVIDNEGQVIRMHKRILQLKRKQKKQGYLSYWDAYLLRIYIEDYGDVKL